MCEYESFIKPEFLIIPISLRGEDLGIKIFIFLWLTLLTGRGGVWVQIIITTSFAFLDEKDRGWGFESLLQPAKLYGSLTVNKERLYVERAIIFSIHLKNRLLFLSKKHARNPLKIPGRNYRNI